MTYNVFGGMLNLAQLNTLLPLAVHYMYIRPHVQKVNLVQ